MARSVLKVGVRCGASGERLLRLALVGGALTLGTQVHAADMGAQAAMPPAPASWASTITHAVSIEAGIAGNPDNPSDHLNFGQEFSDKPNEPLFNQLLVTITRPIDSAAKGYDFGFTLQGLYGSDGRYTSTYGLFNYQQRGIVQGQFLAANLLVHTPWLTPGGIDFKIGINPGAAGYEALDPSVRPFYTYSYISNYLNPYEQTGIQATIHVNPTLDILTGIDTGASTTFGSQGDNNSVPAGYLGFALNNLLNNKLTVTEVSRFGPEDSLKVLPDANSKFRFWNDLTATYKASDKLTLAGEANYLKDDGINADAFGLAGYALYTLNPQVGLNLRAEVYRDPRGMFTYGVFSNTGFLSLIAGNPDAYFFAAPATYGEITAGLNYKPAALNSDKLKVTLRPEFRYDRSLSGSKPFDVGTKVDQYLFSGDIIVAF